MKTDKTLVVSSHLYEESKLTLTQMGYKLVEIDSHYGFDDAVSSHPDMFMCAINGSVICDSSLHELFIFIKNKKMNNILTCSREACELNVRKYPFDVEFNCVNVGNRVICNKKHTSTFILEFCKTNAIEILNVSQGYTKCSTCVVSNNAIITEDESIYKCAVENDIDVLKIEKGHVLLDGYDYGFIGGCSGLLEKNTLAFNGCLDYHPEANKIYEFCKRHNVDTVNLCQNKLCDVGSIIKLF